MSDWEKIVAALEQGNLSAQQLADILGKSKVAVSHAIGDARKQGYTILSVGKSPDYVYELEHE